MRIHLRYVMAAMLLLMMFSSLAARPALARSTPPTPVRPAGTPGSWYSGGTPPDHDPSLPVLVFVHGKGDSAAGWWSDTLYHGPNDMYSYAYDNGYRTAFVDLEPEGDMWANGQILHQQLVEITGHFDVQRVVIIAHSKGGVDANAAAAFFGAGPMIERVITLGSPHWGTPLADLAFSTWAWWLAALLGQNTDATYVMQTGYMAWFRSVADPGDTVPYYTVSGRKCGPFLTALWWGCVYLGGEDDGVVPLASSHKPGGTIVTDGWWDHDELRLGNRTWGAISGVLEASGSAAQQPAYGVAQGALPGILARGGEVLGEAAGQPFPLESGVRKASLVFYASSPDFTVTLTGPDGATYTVSMEEQLPTDDFFAGAWVGSAVLEKPAAGQWQIQTAASGRTGYLMVAALDSDLQAWLDLGAKVVAPGGRQSARVSLSKAVQNATVTGTLTVNGGQPYATPTLVPASGGAYRATITLPRQEGVHDLSLTVAGSLTDGSAFERTLVSSFAVVPKGTKGPWTGR